MKKCLVLDLDNTLWGGIVGEDGMRGIKLDLNGGSGYIAFQQAILDLHDRGIILAINSKNNYEDAIQVIREHPNMVLRENNFASICINWEDKIENMKKIAEEINIGLDSMVFIDDDPINQALIKNYLPDVDAPNLPANPEQYAKFLLDLPYFKNMKAITDEDKMRGNLYVTERLRKTAEQKYVSREDFLKSLNIEVSCFMDDKSCVPRLAQLTEKTNQFNSNKQPFSEDEINQSIDAKNRSVFYCSARDKFGDYGVVGAAFVSTKDKEWIIESILMSCRALGRGIEEAFLQFIADNAVQNSAQKLSALFTESKKNKPAKEFLAKYFQNFSMELKNINIAPSWIKLSWKK
ncbi:hypothetical protein A2Y47_00940 [Candidatus Giovannonibacteria bacterium RIFCSPLOWO2_12_43_8]|uniref:Uncharacterized protein n=1 Tax=Candidatus Giovannonibacteria bacterium RIFCSPLOWO2_12_43_8 TaxID=1798361 RepID=A0A1F5Y3X1_9BACT|nr:MAG: hypothetical protein A2Y47_00940 [Candidatus Giovannonibacteria bacterium RIFCSPLOWO2_12_43_8]